MKSYILISEPFMYQPGQNVLCCMLLHSGKPDLPVYLSVDRASCFQRLFRIMDDFPVFLLCIRHPDPGKPSDISILPSAFRKEGGTDRKSTRLNSSHVSISYAVFCLKKKKQQ